MHFSFKVELLDKALQRNTIVCLNTDAGKTFIMVLLIKERVVVNWIPGDD